MELFSKVKGYATRDGAIKKLAKELPDYHNYRWMIVSLPNGRFSPAVKTVGTDICGALAHRDVGEF